jgi:Trypsin-like peptidase domain
MRPTLRRGGVAITLASAFIAISSALAVPADASDAAETTTATARPAVPKGNPDFTGIVRLSNCSGSVVRWEGSKPGDKAMMLTNGHCRKTYTADEVEVNIPLVRTVTLLNPDGTDLANVSTTKLIYGTMSKTDVALYQLDLTFADLKSTYDVTPLTIQSKRATPHERVVVISGFWRKAYRCHLNGFVYRIREDIYTWSNSLRYREGGCNVIHGTSGSPVLKAGTRIVVGIHNTTNDNGQKCTLNNPCEVDRQGNITVRQGRHYGEETWWFTTCLSDDGRKLDIDRAGCLLRGPE